MDIVTLIAIGSLIVSMAVAGINVIKALRESKEKDFRESSEYIKARIEADLGSIQAAERIIAMYKVTLGDMRLELDQHRQQIKALDMELTKVRFELRTKNEEIAILKLQQAGS